MKAQIREMLLQIREHQRLSANQQKTEPRHAADSPLTALRNPLSLHFDLIRFSASRTERQYISVAFRDTHSAVL